MTSSPTSWRLQRIPTGPIHPARLGRRSRRAHLDRLKRAQGADHPRDPRAYPSLPFILIGDNSQKDPEIYRAIIDEHPGRILAIYIRNVRAEPGALGQRAGAGGGGARRRLDARPRRRHLAVAPHAAGRAGSGCAAGRSVTRSGRTRAKAAKADAPGVPVHPKAPTVVVDPELGPGDLA